jgi:hypothetical protein
MSYRRSYHASISLSGSVPVSYPASEHGGTTTAYWDHTEPVSIDITVDTTPFDSSVQSCNGHVLALGAAVGVMETAQCAAIQRGAAQVSASLEKGFFGTIKTELGAQMADLKNQFEAKLGLMVQQAKTSKAGLERMQRDFERIVSRYQELFRNLDEECRHRVLELDRPSFRLADEVVGTLLTQRRLSLAATSLTISREVGETQSLLVVSRIRRKALGMLESAKLHLVQERAVGRSLRDILLPQRLDARKALRLPVLVMVADGERGVKETTVRGPDGFAKGTADAVKAGVTRDPENSGSWKWTTMPPAARARLQREYMMCVDKRFGAATSEADQRTATLMAQMWESSSAPCVAARLQENA